MVSIRHILLLLFLLGTVLSNAQNDTIPNKKRLLWVGGSTIIGTAGSIILLDNIWYNDYKQTNFHFFNDNPEWLQMDKAGHVLTAYHINAVGKSAFLWTGLNHNKATLVGGAISVGWLTAVEVLDGYSDDWGFSWGDETSDLLGAGLFIGQEYLWLEQRITPKFSVHLTPYAKIRPSVLGVTVPQRLFKDYNGQTYWLSVNIASFLKEKTSFPSWINVAFGYSGEEMIVGDNADYVVFNTTTDYYHRYRQFYLSMDVDLSKLKLKSKLLAGVLKTFSVIKIPFPALEFSKNGIIAKGFYF